MKHNKGQGLIEYALIITLCAIVLIMIILLFWGAAMKPPCAKESPTAGDIVNCIGTMTAEAHNR